MEVIAEASQTFIDEVDLESSGDERDRKEEEKELSESKVTINRNVPQARAIIVGEPGNGRALMKILFDG